MPDPKDRDDEKETIYVPVLQRDPYTPFSERHPRRGLHVTSGLILLALGILVFLIMAGDAWSTVILGVALVGLGILTAAEGLVSPLTRTSAILHVAAAAMSGVVILSATLAALVLVMAGAWPTAVVAAVVALATVYRLVEHRTSTREAWAVARKGAPAWWRSGKDPRKGKD